MDRSSNDVIYISNIYPGGIKTPQQFYMDVYKESLFEYSDCGSSLIINGVKNNRVNLKYFKFTLLFFITTIIIIIIIVVIKNYKKKL